MSKKTILQHIFIGLILIFASAVGTSAQGNAFNFQGRLNEGANPANGAYDLQFRLYDAIAGGTQIGSIPLNADFQINTLPNSNPNQVVIDTFRSDTGEIVRASFSLIVF